VVLLIVGIWITGPTPQSQPLVGLRGERKGENVVGAVPTGTVGTGDRSGFQTTGRIVR